MADRHDPRQTQIHLPDHHRHTENLGAERHRQIVLDHGEEATELLMLVMAIHNCLGDQSVELGITERRHPRRIENRIRRLTSSRQQRTTGLWFACKIKVGQEGQDLLGFPWG